MVLCERCHNKALFACGRCKRRYYCGEAHMSDDWYDGHSQECNRMVMGGVKRPRGEEDETQRIQLQKQSRQESCPRELSDETKEVFRDALGGVTDEDLETLKNDTQINKTCQKLIGDMNSMSEVCKDFMQESQIEMIMLKIYNSRQEKKNIDIDWELPLIYRGLIQYHEAYTRVVMSEEPSTESGSKALGSHVEGLTSDFVEFYRLLCPYLNDFVSGNMEDRDIKLSRIKRNLNRIEARIHEVEMEMSQFPLVTRIVTGAYGMMCKIFKVFALRILPGVAAILALLPYHYIINTEMAEVFVNGLAETGYTIPPDFYILRGEPYGGSTVNSWLAWWRGGSTVNPWAQTGINALFSIAITASSIHNSILSVTRQIFSFLCSELLRKMGFTVFASGLAGSAAAYVLAATMGYFAKRLYGWYAAYRKDVKMKEDMKKISKDFRALTLDSYEKALKRQ